MRPRPHALSDLPGHLALAWGLLIVYACLNPFTGWRLGGLPWWDFLTAPWPRYYTGLDLAFNVLGFVPLGFLLTPLLAQRMRRGWAVVLATLAAGTLSLGLEVLQNLLPSRVASNVDLGCNALGALLGALAGAAWGPALFDRRGGLHRWRQRRILPGKVGDVGLVLFGLWLLAQLTPGGPLFATGDLRELLALPLPLSFDPRRYLRLEAALTATSLLAVGLLGRQMLRAPGYPALAAALLAGIAVKMLATASFFLPGEPFHWATPGALTGLAAGAGLLGATLFLPTGLRQALASLTLLAATALANLLPENPYLVGGPLVREGHFLNFHGLTQLVGALWPFLALALLSALGRRPPDGRPGTPPRTL